jgi:glucose/arabinose dehydrogenase
MDRKTDRPSSLAVVVLVSGTLLGAVVAGAVQPGGELIEEQKGHSVRLQVRTPSEDEIASLRVPQGFRVAKFADGLGTPRMLRVANDGTVYVTRPDAGDVQGLRDRDGDGRAEERFTAVEGLDGVHDVALRGDDVFLVTVRELYRASRGADGKFGKPEKVLDGLPEGGRHPNRTIAFGPDGALYVSVGSTCNACVEPHEEAAAIVRVHPDGSDRRLFATGLRNTIGFGWHPETRAMWGMDHNTDWLGDDFPQEELNLLEDGKHYGWPFVHDDGQMPDVIEKPAGFDAAAYRARSTSPVLGYTAHTAPMQLAFYDGDAFPEAYRGDAFVALHGSWNRKPPAGFEVVRVDFEGGTPVRIEPFLTGFVRDGDALTLGRPTGVAVARDGALLVGDDETGIVYRVASQR